MISASSTSMKLILFSLALVLSGLVPLVADPNIPDSAWEKHPERFELAVILSNQIDNHRTISSIQALLKNIGKTSFFTSLNSPILPFQIFYVNDSKALIALRDYNPKPGPLLPVEQSVMPYEVKQGEVVSGAVMLTPNELALIKRHPVICKVFVSDHESGGYKLFASSPKILVGP